MSIPNSLKIALKVILWTIASILILISLSLAAIVWILNPAQLTPICEEYANEYLDAKVSIEKVELTIWKTFPYATVDVNNLTIVSNAFNSLTTEQRATLPANADTLVCSHRIHASINLLKISLGTFELRDIMLDAPMINAVAFNDNIANYNITPPSSDEPTEIPNITLNSFEITNGKGISYYNAQNNISANIDITAAQITEMSNKNYQFIFNGNTALTAGEDIEIPNFPLRINGIIEWNQKKPLVAALNNWDISVNNVPIKVNFAMDMEKAPIINKMEIQMDSVTLQSVMPFIPKTYAKSVDQIKTDINSSLSIKLLRPYKILSDIIPYLNVDINIPESYVKFPNGRGIDRLIVNANIAVNGANLDSTIVTLKKLYMQGKSLDFNIDGKVDNLISNAHIKGSFKGKADINKIITTLKIPLQFSISGIIDANATLDARVKQMNVKNFHLMKINGDVNLRNFNFLNYKDSMTVYSRRMNLKFGTGNDIVKNGQTIHGISYATINTDTLSLQSLGLKFSLKNGVIAGGIKGNKVDSTTLVPIGAKLTAERVNIVDIDSVVIKLRKLECNANIRRMVDHPTKPIIDFDIRARRLSYADSTTRMSVKNAEIQMNAMNRINNRSKINAIADSLGQIYRELSRDSILSLARKERRSKLKTPVIAVENTISLKADSGIQQILKKWQISGFFKAERGRLFTPFFPLRNTISNIDINFSTDSLIVNNIDYKTGHSMFSINGGVRNIRSTLLGRKRKPISLILNVESDTIDVNELITATFAGSNYMNNVSERYSLGTGDSEEHIEMLTANAAENNDSILAAITIPQNIDAEINIRARNGVYADMIMKRARGTLLIHDGQLQLRNIRANTDRGSMAFNALYSAPTKKKIRFAFDLSMKNIDIDRFIEIIPAVDTILPLLKSMDGIIHADVAATTDVDSLMNVIMPSLKAAIKLRGDSLVLFDSETFTAVSKMLRFKNKKRNLIDNMEVEILIQDSQLELFPFTFTMDRYKLGVMGHNDLSLNLNYHISVLKSPIPFKFGLNITGHVDNLKYRIGGAKFKEDHVAKLHKIVDTTRINLREQIHSLFQRGARAGLNSSLRINGGRKSRRLNNVGDTLSHSDSLRLIKEGIIEAPIEPKLSPKELKAKQKAEEKARKEEEKKRKKEEKKNKKRQSEETAWIETRQKQK